MFSKNWSCHILGKGYSIVYFVVADVETTSWTSPWSPGRAVPGDGAVWTAGVQRMRVSRTRRELRDPRVLAGGGRQSPQRAHRNENGHGGLKLITPVVKTSCQSSYLDPTVILYL